MVSHASYYGYKFPAFYDWYMKWFSSNCEDCPYFSHNVDGISGYCYFEQIEQFLSCKKRSTLYIGIYYHKKLNGKACLIKKELDARIKK